MGKIISVTVFFLGFTALLFYLLLFRATKGSTTSVVFTPEITIAEQIRIRDSIVTGDVSQIGVSSSDKGRKTLKLVYRDGRQTQIVIKADSSIR